MQLYWKVRPSTIPSAAPWVVFQLNLGRSICFHGVKFFDDRQIESITLVLQYYNERIQRASVTGQLICLCLGTIRHDPGIVLILSLLVDHLPIEVRRLR